MPPVSIWMDTNNTHKNYWHVTTGDTEMMVLFNSLIKHKVDNANHCCMSSYTNAITGSVFLLLSITTESFFWLLSNNLVSCFYMLKKEKNKLIFLLSLLFHFMSIMMGLKVYAKQQNHWKHDNMQHSLFNKRETLKEYFQTV